ncbi:MAG: putative serine/threonine-protein kinase Nek3, partial [Streblomastix strix]
RFAEVEFKNHEAAEAITNLPTQKLIIGGVIMQIRWEQTQRKTNVIFNRQKHRHLLLTDIQRKDGVNFKAALQLATEIFNEKLNEDKRRIVLFTSNSCNSDVSAECNSLESLGVRIDVVGFGEIDIQTLTKLIICGGRVFVYDNMEGIIQIFKQMAEDNFVTEPQPTESSESSSSTQSAFLSIYHQSDFKQSNCPIVNSQETVKFITAIKVENQSEISTQPTSIQGINTSWKKQDFKKEKWLGQGAFGSVWLVRQIITQQLMAWKKIRFSSEKVRNSFFIENDDTAYILLEYCSGGDMRKYIENVKSQNQTLSPDQVWEFISQFTVAINQLHSKRIIHGDLKPENTLITNNNKIKLADFGLARKLKESRGFATSNHGGTLNYLPPEMLLGSNSDKVDMARNPPPYDNIDALKSGRNQRFAADIWAIGVMTYELVMLKHPFIGNNEGQIPLGVLIDRVRNEEPLEISSDYPEAMKNLIMAMLIKNPYHRITAEQILLVPEVAQILENS